jgi:uncharacterized protein YebE (UPF0316 family)
MNIDLLLKFGWVFLVGFIECFCSTLNTKFVVRNNRLLSFLTAFLNILIWAYVVALTVENIKNFSIIVIYAIGFGIGVLFAIQFDKYLDKIAKFKGLKLKKKKRVKARKR